MPFIILLIIVEIAFIHIRLTQLTRKHTPQFCLRILTRLKVLLTQPFDMSNPFCKQSTGVLNAAHLLLFAHAVARRTRRYSTMITFPVVWVLFPHHEDFSRAMMAGFLKFVSFCFVHVGFIRRMPANILI